MPGRLGITITGPLSARAGADAKTATAASTIPKQAETRDMKPPGSNSGAF